MALGLGKASKMNDLVANPAAKAIVDKFIPGLTDNEIFKAQAMELPLKLVCSFPEVGVTKETAKAMYAELEVL